mmetsp:Transcript_114344/g.318314  ORF Transcript_114344/g.318314 Transcript_114344/m.318314 type:complete len:452 (+) Transcript_114344:110-1465(+)
MQLRRGVAHELVRGPDLLAHDCEGLAPARRLLAHSHDREVAIHGALQRGRSGQLVEEVREASMREVRLVVKGAKVLSDDALAGPQPAEVAHARVPHGAYGHLLEAAIPKKCLRPEGLPLQRPAEHQAAVLAAPGRRYPDEAARRVEEHEAAHHQEVLHGGVPRDVLRTGGPVIEDVGVPLHLLPVHHRVGPCKLHSRRWDACCLPLLVGEGDRVRGRTLRRHLHAVRAADAVPLEDAALHRPMEAPLNGLWQEEVLGLEGHLLEAEGAQLLGEGFEVREDMDRAPRGQLGLGDAHRGPDRAARRNLPPSVVELLGIAGNARERLADLQQVTLLPIAGDGSTKERIHHQHAVRHILARVDQLHRDRLPRGGERREHLSDGLALHFGGSGGDVRRDVHDGGLWAVRHDWEAVLLGLEGRLPARCQTRRQGALPLGGVLQARGLDLALGVCLLQ